MKKLVLCTLLAAGLLSIGCNDSSSPDSVKAAKKENEQTLDSTKEVLPGDNKIRDTGLTKTDADFAVAAADGGMMEVVLGNLAQKNAASKAVKDFGKMMVDDHSKAGGELKAMAATKNISLPSALGNDHQKKVDALSKKTGKEFDKDYMSLMVEDHEEDIKAFKTEAENGSDTALRSWASTKIPVLEHHLMAAKKAKDEVNGKH
jgi:putative membrane protein